MAEGGRWLILVMTTATVTTPSGASVVLAESATTVIVEGNHYFPSADVKWEYFTETERTTGCPWKGTANYYSVEVEGERLDNVAWTYHQPKDAAEEIRDHVAFYPAVSVS